MPFAQHSYFEFPPCFPAFRLSLDKSALGKSLFEYRPSGGFLIIQTIGHFFLFKLFFQASKDWSSLVSNLEGRRDTLTKLAEVWASFEEKWQRFESGVSGIEERAKHVDQVVRNRDHVIAAKKDVEVNSSVSLFAWFSVFQRL